MGALISLGIEKLGGLIDDEIGGDVGNVIGNVFQYWANGIRVADDLFAIATFGGSAAIEKAAAGDLLATKAVAGAATGAKGLIPDVIRSSMGIVQFIRDPTREDINDLYNEKVDPYLNSTFGEDEIPAGFSDIIKAFQPTWLSPIAKHTNDLARESRYSADLMMTGIRRAHDLQVRAAGDVIGIKALQDIRDPGRRFNNASYVRMSRGWHWIKIASEQLAEAREIWDRAEPDQKREIENKVVSVLKQERKTIGQEEEQERQAFRRDPGSSIVGPAFIAPRETLR